MKREFQYRDYTVYYDGTEYVAEVTHPDDMRVFELGSHSLNDIVAAIDELYDAVEQGRTPDWYLDWLEGCGFMRARAPDMTRHLHMITSIHPAERIVRNKLIREHFIAKYGPAFRPDIIAYRKDCKEGEAPGTLFVIEAKSITRA